ncbi:hypothetical protein BD309DRAFT_964904 [Dichomitus squalens]|nr:hypothetical protein BD309DRAFT_964904 [Dichomitus squalens]
MFTSQDDWFFGEAISTIHRKLSDDHRRTGQSVCKGCAGERRPSIASWPWSVDGTRYSWLNLPYATASQMPQYVFFPSVPVWFVNLQGIYQYQPPIYPLNQTRVQTPPVIPAPLDQEDRKSFDLSWRRGGWLESAVSNGYSMGTWNASQRSAMCARKVRLGIWKRAIICAVALVMMISLIIVVVTLF